VALSNGAVKLDAVVLYADLASSTSDPVVRTAAGYTFES
jgi:hypothetical protein